jgi:hypothetical protein
VFVKTCSYLYFELRAVDVNLSPAVIHEIIGDLDGVLSVWLLDELGQFVGVLLAGNYPIHNDHVVQHVVPHVHRTTGVSVVVEEHISDVGLAALEDVLPILILDLVCLKFELPDRQLRPVESIKDLV